MTHFPLGFQTCSSVSSRIFSRVEAWRCSPYRSFNVFEAQIKKYLHSNFTFVQVVANDGKRFDPINKYVVQYKWRGIVIEPIQEYFDELLKT